MRNLAGLLTAQEEAQHDPSSGIPCQVAFVICEKLRPQLAMLMGRGGYHALISRALALSGRDVDWLRKVSLTEASVLRIAAEEINALDTRDVAIGSQALVSELLGLLAAFIGDSLTLRLVREVWPTLSFEELNLIKGEQP